MYITEKIDTYLVESNARKLMDEIMGEIRGAKSTDELMGAAKKAEDFVNKHGKESFMKSFAKFFGSKGVGTTEEQLMKFSSAIKKQRGKLDHKEMMDRVRKFKEENF